LRSAPRARRLGLSPQRNNPLFESGLQNQSAPAKPSEALELLRQDIATHREQTANKSYLGTAVSTITSLGRADSLAPVEKLSADLQDAVKKGDDARAAKLAADASMLVSEDKKAMHTDSLVTQYGTGMIKTAGLFIPGKPGYALAGLAYALDQAKPGDSFGNQLTDGGLGLAKGMALKGTFQHVGGMELGIAAKAVTLGISSRVADSALTRQTYSDGNGGYNALTGLTRTLDKSFNRNALVSDVVTFGLAYGALGGLNGITGGALKNSPFFSTIATGGVFGISSGSVQEINRQQEAGEKFDFGKVLTSAALTGATDMIAAGPGAKMTSMRASALESQSKPAEHQTNADQTSTLADQLKGAPTIERNFPGSTSREFQLVDGNQQLIEQLRNSPDRFILAPVQEVSPTGSLGPEKNMLIQHLQPGQSGAPKTFWYQAADLIASCNPKLLPEDFQSKHIIPSAESLYLTQGVGGRIRFSDTVPIELRPNQPQPIKLGNTVSELILGSQTPKHLEDTHDKAAIAAAMRNFKTPVRYFNGGADSIAFELPDHHILKITDHGWDPTWGTREIWTPQGMKRIDAPILQKPQTINVDRETAVTYFVQKRMMSPVTANDLRLFDNQIERDGKYKFWDNDFQSHGKNQLGFDPDTHELYVIDYDSVRLPHLVPDQTIGGSSWVGNRYFHRYEH
jgi:hypothetical protein